MTDGEINYDHRTATHYQLRNSGGNVACFNGSAHVRTAMDKKKVTCPICLDQITKKLTAHQKKIITAVGDSPLAMYVEKISKNSKLEAIESIFFTKAEWEIIEHRLHVSDCIAECIEEDHETVYQTCRNLMISKRVTNGLEREIIKDCCEGSTFFANIQDAVLDGEMTKGKMLSYFKSAKSLGEKLEVEVCTD